MLLPTALLLIKSRQKSINNCCKEHKYFNFYLPPHYLSSSRRHTSERGLCQGLHALSLCRRTWTQDFPNWSLFWTSRSWSFSESDGELRRTGLCSHLYRIRRYRSRERVARNGILDLRLGIDEVLMIFLWNNVKSFMVMQLLRHNISFIYRKHALCGE